MGIQLTLDQVEEKKRELVDNCFISWQKDKFRI